MQIKVGYDVEIPVDVSGKRRGIFPRQTAYQRNKAQSICCWNRFVEVQHEASRDFVQALIIAEPKKTQVVPSLVHCTVSGIYMNGSKCTRIAAEMLRRLAYSTVCGAGHPCGTRKPI
jgi:hypothetical protein